MVLLQVELGCKLRISSQMATSLHRHIFEHLLASLGIAFSDLSYLELSSMFADATYMSSSTIISIPSIIICAHWTLLMEVEEIFSILAAENSIPSQGLKKV